MARSLLERYILLTYSSSSVAQAAFVLLSADPKILSVEHNGVFSYSSIPNDRYFSQDLSQPATSNYQWGMQLLNLPTAWDKMRGSSYIGVIDSGIDCMAGTSPCLTHVDLRQNFRAQFSVNVSGGSPSLIVDSLGHGTHVAGIVAATPQFGAYSNGNSNSGVAGACWTCSLAVVKTDGTFATFATAMTFAVDHGSQVLNLSFGDGAKNTGRFGTCSDSKFSAMCTAIQYARDRDVIVVAAAGNRYEARIQFPASSPDVLAVGGVQPGGGFWNTGYGNSNVCVMGQPGDECGSNYGSNMAVVAPAADVVSTFPLNASYNSNVHCGDAFGPDAGSLNAYGDCTGTSMSTPHVTGIVGLLRSVNPLQNRNQVKAILTANTNPCSGMDSNKCGSGIPDASRAVNAALGGENVKNRTTPLFSFYSSSATDHFFTTVPQMAVAALNSGQLLPQPGPGSILYQPIGTPTPGYNEWPTPSCTFSPCLTYPQPRGIASILVSHSTPTLGGPELAPLYRYSFVCTTSCANPNHVSHVYSADSSENWASVGYELDGIEGYIFPKTQAQPIGTAKLCRKYDAARDDYILFLASGPNGTDCSASSDETGGNYQALSGFGDWIGWVYPLQPNQAICVGGVPCLIAGALTPQILLLD
jgi:subtilisin family serine protease